MCLYQVAELYRTANAKATYKTSSLEQELRALTQKCAALESKNSELQQQLTKANTEVQEANEVCSKKDTHLKTLKRAYDKLDADYTDLENELTTSKADAQESKRVCSEKEKEVLTYQTNMSDMRERHDALIITVLDLTEKVHDLEESKQRIVADGRTILEMCERMMQNTSNE